MSHITGSPYPDKHQELLLRAGILVGPEALEAWDAWLASFNLEDPLDNGSFRTLPLIYRNLSILRPDDVLLPKLKGAYRQTWYKNQQLLHSGMDTVRQLQEKQIPVIILKGAALSKLYYQDFGLRPMADLDILVPYGHAPAAIDVLKAGGFIAENEAYLEYNLRYGKSMGFRHKDKAEIDLHWYPFFEALNQPVRDIWDLAIPVELAGCTSKAMCHADNFVHTITHGMRWNPEPPIRWIADAMRILGQAASQPDWNRVIELVRRFRISLQMREAIVYLESKFGARVPADFRMQLFDMPTGYPERYVFREHMKRDAERLPESFFPRLRYLFGVYLRQSGNGGFLLQLPGFLRFLLYRTSGKNRMKILLYYLRRAKQKSIKK